jgi:hypothetical protein
MTQTLLECIEARYPIRPIDVGAFAHLKVKGMKFTISAYEAEELGHVSVMRAKGFLGLMKMDTLIIAPKEKDLPLYSYDRIHAMGNDTLIIELYHTILGQGYDSSALVSCKSAYGDLPGRDPGVHWYDSIKCPESISLKGGKKETTRLDALARDYLIAYLATPCDQVTDQEEKQKQNATYVTGLLANGGPSTDVFKKELGIDMTSTLFTKVLFGILN